MKKKPKPKYYLRRSFNYDDWFCICQVSNNVMVAEIPEKVVAELVLDFLNDLPRGMIERAKVGVIYKHIKKNKPK
ncbi:MAG: hypothetical protein KDJ52_01790 [Anaerolineae bacterium]|nr:hypothetical protein [Anaerolineae bacterium]